MKMRKTVLSGLKQLLCLFLGVLILAPFYVALVNSFKTKGEASDMSAALPSALQWGNYLVVIQKGKLVMSFLNSLLYSTASVTLCVLLAVMAAYVISRNRTRLNRVMYYFLVLGIVLPTNVVALMKIMQVIEMTHRRIGVVVISAAM